MLTIEADRATFVTHYNDICTQKNPAPFRILQTLLRKAVELRLRRKGNLSFWRTQPVSIVNSMPLEGMCVCVCLGGGGNSR